MRTALLFVVFPYVAAGVLALGLGFRFVRAGARTAATRAQADEAWALFGGCRMWRAGLVLVVAAHLLGLLLPDLIRSWNRAALRLYALEGAGLLFGVLALAGWARVMRRHLGRATGARVAEAADCLWLSLVFVALASGLATAIRYRWASSWAGATLGPYLGSLLRGAPTTALVERMPALVKLHVLSLFAVLAVLPATRLALALVVGLRGVTDRLARPLAAGVRTGRRVLARLSPARWIWPEEDLAEAEVATLAEGAPLAEVALPDGESAPARLEPRG
jgi:nitrate reductase gamma subunit